VVKSVLKLHGFGCADKALEINEAFAGYGKTLCLEHEVSGHDFSRAANATE
jgi:hypothetical protein